MGVKGARVKEVSHKIDKILKIKLPLEPNLFILQKCPYNVCLKQKEYKFIDICILQAKHLLPYNGRILIDQGKERVERDGKITFIVKGNHNAFKEVWSPLIFVS